MKRAVPAGRQGFTLIEIVISFSCLILISAAFFYFFKLGIDFQKKSKDFFAALNLAQKTMEEIRAQPFQAISSKTFAEGRGQININQVSSNLKEIILNLKWDAKRAPIELYTLRAK